jgi:cytochrome P450
MSGAPRFDIDPGAFWDDPYPDLARMRAEAPICFVPQLGATVRTRRDDIAHCEKRIEIFSSHQPEGLMNRLMGRNMMRKDGEEHLAERRAIFPTVSPRTVRDHWKERFQAHVDAILARLEPRGEADLLADFALPAAGEALKELTGLTQIHFTDMDRWSQAMIDGIANYAGIPEVEARCHKATAEIDAAIDDMLPLARGGPNPGLLSVMLEAGMPIESVRANVKLAISGGQNESRDAIAGLIWAMLAHPDQHELVRTGRASWLGAFEEYARWISPIGMSPRRVARDYAFDGVDFEPEERVFFMFGSANRDEAVFETPETFDVTRDNTKSMPFGAGPHFCAGAAASRTLVAAVAVPSLMARLQNLRLADPGAIRFGGWAFRGLLALPARWG